MCRLLAYSTIFMATALAGCASSGPHRTAEDKVISAATDGRCEDLYSTTDHQIFEIATNFSKNNDDRTTFLDQMQKYIESTPENLRICWTTAYERHDDYDLLYAEFDDAGGPTDIARGVVYQQSELYLIEHFLLNALETEEKEGGGLNIILFSHGWHGNARADNDYSIEFKGVLQNITEREKKYSFRAAHRSDFQKPRRTIGVEVSWRGDSLLTPAIPFLPESKNVLNVWDRKIASDTVARGAVQELFAFLNELYRENSCSQLGSAKESPTTTCDAVHLLTLGHSFGAQIDLHALLSRIESGLNVPSGCRVYGFGDLTILLNPAFEGARFRPIFNNAISRPVLRGPYLGDLSASSTCRGRKNDVPGAEEQLPTLITLQSLGDTATGRSFRYSEQRRLLLNKRSLRKNVRTKMSPWVGSAISELTSSLRRQNHRTSAKHPQRPKAIARSPIITKDYQKTAPDLVPKIGIICC